ncbi:MAG TPA: hypothetical protein VJM08_00035 [Anaerolineales bacterium]|nr:hypothetical protein [Anaerolineales bacterium]
MKLQISSSLIASAPHSEDQPAHRLIVLVPDNDLDYAAATRRVWELASDMGTDIQFIGLCKDERQESSLRRQLVIMTAMIQDGDVSAEAKVEFGNNWVNVVKSNWQAGDVIVCFAEQRAGLLQRPLSQILRANLDIPTYILSDLYPLSPSRSHGLSLIALWIGFIAIIGGSFLLQIQVIALTGDWAQTNLLILSVIAELWLIWVWNKLFH